MNKIVNRILVPGMVGAITGGITAVVANKLKTKGYNERITSLEQETITMKELIAHVNNKVDEHKKYQEELENNTIMTLTADGLSKIIKSNNEKIIKCCIDSTIKTMDMQMDKQLDSISKYIDKAFEDLKGEILICNVDNKDQQAEQQKEQQAKQEEKTNKILDDNKTSNEENVVRKESDNVKNSRQNVENKNNNKNKNNKKR